MEKKESLFYGYHGLSSVIGEYSVRKGYADIIDIIDSQLTFLLDKQLFWRDEWFAGAALRSADTYLLEDLESYSGMHLELKSMTLEEELAEIERNQMVIVAVNFNCFGMEEEKFQEKWRILETNPRFVLTTEIDLKKRIVMLTEPYNQFTGKLPLEQYISARVGEEGTENLKNMGYLPSFSSVNERNLDADKLFYDRVERFCKMKMYDNIIDLEEEMDKRRLIGGKKQDRGWVGNGYQCLRSSLYQHRNINRFIRKHMIDVPEEFLKLEEQWETLLELMRDYCDYRLDALEEICHLVLKIGRAERDCNIRILNLNKEVYDGDTTGNSV